VMAGGATMGRILAANAMQPIQPDYVLPQLTQRSTGWYYNKMPVCDFDSASPPSKLGGEFCTLITFTPAQNVVKFYYNTQLVSKKELAGIKSWDDLLQPKWKGKWVIQNVAQNIDPSDRQLGWALLGEKYWAKFMKVLAPTVLDTGGDVVATNGVLRGQWDFAGFIGDTSPYILAQQQGLPIAFFTKILKPGALPDLGQRVSLLAQAPDQAAAELYLNWSLTPQGQAAWNEGAATQGDTALYKKAPKGQVPGYIWTVAIHTKKIYVAADHLADINNSLAWWTQEMAKLNIH
jgi:ABC-type Fe3+ transport system substrate-binding protein